MSDGSAPQAAASASAASAGAVVLLAQVGRDDVAQPGVMALREDARRAVVGQVAVRPADARLQRGRVARLRKHRAVVVALQHQRIAALQAGPAGGPCSSPRRSARRGAAARRVQLSCSGSSASCGTVNGCSCRSPTTMASPSRAKRSRPSGSAGSPSARQVPRLVHSGRRWRRDSVSAQPTWSPCSWVTKRASRSAIAQPGAGEPHVEFALREAAVHEHAARRSCRCATRSPARCRRCRCPGCKSASISRGVSRRAGPRTTLAGGPSSHFRSASSRLTMRWPASPFSGAPWLSSTVTMLALPSPLTLTR